MRSAKLTSAYSAADSSILQQPLEPAQGIVPRISQVAKTMVDRVLRPARPTTTTGLEHAVTHAVADMLISIKEAIERIHSVQHETIYLVLPNSILRLKSEYWFWFKSAAAMANLPTFSGHYFLSTQAAMREFYGIGNCPDIPVDWYTSVPDLPCEEYNGRRIRTVLSIDYSTSNLNLMLLPREEGFFYPDLSTVVEHFELGAASVLRKDHPDEYWAVMKEALSAITRTTEHSIDLLTLHGDQATDPKFLSTVEEVFRLNRDIRKEDYLQTSTDHLFASARAAAREARIGMLTGFEICIRPDWCPQGEEDIPDEYKWKAAEPGVTDSSTKEEL